MTPSHRLNCDYFFQRFDAADELPGRCWTGQVFICALLVLSLAGCFRMPEISSDNDQGDPDSSNSREEIVTDVTLSRGDTFSRSEGAARGSGETASTGTANAGTDEERLKSIDLLAVDQPTFLKALGLRIEEVESKLQALRDRASGIPDLSPGRWQRMWETLQQDQTRLLNSYEELRQARATFWQDYRPSVMANHQMLLRNLEKAHRHLDQYEPNMPDRSL